MLEREIENPVVNWARGLGLLVTKLNLLGQRAWPDRVFWVPGGRPLLIEFKRPGGKPRKLQEENHRRLRELGYVVYVCDNVRDGKLRVKEALDAARLSGQKR